MLEGCYSRHILIDSTLKTLSLELAGQDSIHISTSTGTGTNTLTHTHIPSNVDKVSPATGESIPPSKNMITPIATALDFH